MGGDVVVEAFTELAPRYEETIDWEVREFCGLGYREFIGHMVGRVPIENAGEILDVACGTAVSSIEIAGKAGPTSHVVGLDITPAMLEYGARNLEHLTPPGRISLVCASGMDLPLAAEAFDVVVCGLGTHHMDVGRLVSELRRVLKDGGRLVMADMAAPEHWRKLWGRVIMRTAVEGFRFLRKSPRAQAEADAFTSIHTAREWRSILAAAGFGKIEMTEWPPRRFWYPSALLMDAVREK